MKQLALGLLVLLAVLAVTAPAQPGLDNAPRGTITGQVYDADLNQPVEYANIVLYRLRDSSQVTGTVTRADGRFTLADVPPGRYYAVVSFIGYRDQRVDGIQLAPGARVDIGTKTLRQVAVAVEGVEARAERPELTYRIDKKVVEVAGRPSAEAGTAVDVLENVPSVKVDIEGNVSLRGSENFKVLIDGRPSPLDPSDALQQVPSASIDRIELITNPSAKYDPEGVSGIVNVILKKQRGAGLSGVVNANAGLRGKYGGDGLLSYRHGIVGAFASAGYNRRNSPADGATWRETWTVDSLGDTTYSYVSAAGKNAWGGRHYNFRGGVDLQWVPSDRTSLSARVGSRGGSNTRTADYREWTSPGADTTFYTSLGAGSRGGGFYMATLDHQHKFAGREGHELTATFDLSRRDGSDSSLALMFDVDGDTTSGQLTREAGPGGRLSFQADYALPLRTEDKLEAGYSARFHTDKETTYYSDWRPDSGYVLRPEYSFAGDFREQVHALYATYSAQFGKFGVKPGTRFEYDDRTTRMDSAALADVSELGFFPSLHASYELPAQMQLMASYVRRIDRPRGWDLQPGRRRFDRYTAGEGNPGLKPEYINSFELGWQVPLGSSRISAETYLRGTENLIQRITSIDSIDPTLLVHRPENVGTDRSIGVELLADLNPWKFLNVNLTGTAYDYRLNAGSEVKTSFNWDSRLTAELRLPTQTRLQVIGMYESPSVTAGGTSAGFASLNAAARQAFFDRRLSIALQVRNILGTSRHEFTSEGERFRSSVRFNSESPVVMLSLTWNFNNYRPDRRQRLDSGEMEEENGGNGGGGF